MPQFQQTATDVSTFTHSLTQQMLQMVQMLIFQLYFQKTASLTYDLCLLMNKDCSSSNRNRRQKLFRISSKSNSSSIKKSRCLVSRMSWNAHMTQSPLALGHSHSTYKLNIRLSDHGWLQESTKLEQNLIELLQQKETLNSKTFLFLNPFRFHLRTMLLERRTPDHLKR